MNLYTRATRQHGETIDDVVEDYRLSGRPEYEIHRVGTILSALAKSLPVDVQDRLAEELGWTPVRVPDSREP